MAAREYVPIAGCDGQRGKAMDNGGKIQGACCRSLLLRRLGPAPRRKAMRRSGRLKQPKRMRREAEAERLELLLTEKADCSA